MKNVMIFQFEMYDVHTDSLVTSRRWGTREAIEQIARGVAIEASATEVPRAFLMSDIPGLTKIGFDPLHLKTPQFQPSALR